MEFHQTLYKCFPLHKSRITTSGLFKMTQKQVFTSLSGNIFICLHELHHMKSLTQDYR